MFHVCQCQGARRRHDFLDDFAKRRDYSKCAKLPLHGHEHDVGMSAQTHHSHDSVKARPLNACFLATQIRARACLPTRRQ